MSHSLSEYTKDLIDSQLICEMSISLIYENMRMST